VFTVELDKALSGDVINALRTIDLLLENVTTEVGDFSTTYTAYYYTNDVARTGKTALTVTGNQVVLPGGITKFYVVVSTTADAVYEGAEDLRLTATFNDAALKFANRSSGAVRTGATANDTATIVDDGSGKVYDNEGADTLGTTDDDLPTVSIGVNPAGISEGDASETDAMTYTVTLSNASAQDTVVTITLTGSATLTTDYAISGLTATGTAGVYTLTIAAGSLTGTFTVDPVGDGVFEGAETVIATITGASTTNTAGGTVNLSATTAAATGTIFDDGSLSGGDDDRPVLTVSGVPDVSEGSFAVFTVQLGRGMATSLSDATRTINLTLGNVTTQANDYLGSYQWSTDGNSWTTVAGNQIVLPANVSTFYVQVSTVNDGVFEGAETLSLTASFDAPALRFVNGLSGAVRNGATGTGTATLLDDGTGRVYDANGVAAGGLSDDDRPISIDSFSVNEGSTHAVFRVVAAPGSTIRLALSDGLVNLGPNGDGARGNGVDYGNATGPDLEVWNGSAWVPYNGGDLTVPAGTSDQQPLLVRTAIVNDAFFERSEDFRLTATYHVAGLPTTGAFTGTATIRDDGQGVIFLFNGPNGAFSGTTDRNLDDDLRLNVSSFSVNEGSSHAVFTLQVVGGQFLELGLVTGSALSGADFSPALEYWNGASWVTYTGRFAVQDSGSSTLLVRTALVNDTVFEGPETFLLNATYFTALTGGTQLRTASGQATIRDDGSGVRFEFNGPNGAFSGTASSNLDDDRALFVSSPVVNEASSWVVYRVTGEAGSTLDLSLGGNGSTATVGIDTRGPLEIYDGSRWVVYDSTSGARFPAGSSLMLVRVAVVNDEIFEGAESLVLEATVRGGSGLTTTGTARILDDGTGTIFRENGSEDLNAVRDDDRPLKVNSVLVNEGSTYAVFTLRASAGDSLTVSLLDRNTDPANATADLGARPSLQFWNVQANAWTEVTGPVSVPADGTLYVRVNITAEQEREYEGSETFRLAVGSALLARTEFGTATIKDDGTGVRFTGELRPEGPVTSVLDLDDDLDRDGISPTTEDQLSSLVASQGIGNALPGDLNGDGIPDAEQNALATLAWRDVASFTAGNEGALTDVRPIISLMALEGTSDNTVSTSLQLENIRVVAFADAQFGSAADDVSIDGGGIRTVTLADGSTVETPWDPIRFELGPQAEGGAFSDLFPDVDFPDRPGVQVRLYIDLRAAGLNEGEFNSYIKFVSAAAVAGGNLVDLDGKRITAEGWYDFTQRTPGGDGARFVVEAGKIVGIELILTDNAFGDNDMRANRILDPGVLAFAKLAEVTPEPDLVPPALPEVARLPVAEPQFVPLDQGEGPRFTYLPFDSTLYALAAQAQPWALSYLERTRGEAELTSRFSGDLFTRQSDWRAAVVDSEEISLSVLRGMPDQFAEADAAGSFVVPFDAFVHSRVDAWVGLSAELDDGQPLPGWIVLDLKTGVFRFEPPKGWKGELKIKLTARDTDGRTAVTVFRFQVGERAQARAGLSEQLREVSQRFSQRAAERPVSVARPAKVPA
ncbi:MAG: Calx-beta domain-containing protein, partial [Hydrogenophaga sp.]|nr:Calx-beta domain-containing protein [Hydrogenophaga sp.]